jgi:hypothetical protein
VADGLALAVALGVLPLAASAGVVAAPPLGDNEDGVVEGRFCAGNDPEQADTDKDATMVKAAQPMVSLVPVMVMRIFMASSCLRRWGSAGSHKGKAHMRRRHAMACSSLEY